MTEDEAHKIATNCRQLTVVLLEAIEAEFGGEAAMLYAGALTASACAWVTTRHGPVATNDLVARIATTVAGNRH